MSALDSKTSEIIIAGELKFRCKLSKEYKCAFCPNITIDCYDRISKNIAMPICKICIDSLPEVDKKYAKL